MTSTPAPLRSLPAILALRIRLVSVFLLASLGFGTALNAQPLDFQMGNPTEIKLTSPIAKILGKDKETYFVISPEKENNFNLTLFSKNLSPLKSLKIKFSNDIKLVHALRDAWLMEDRIILLTHCFNKAIQQDQYNLWHLSTDGKILRGPVEISRVNGNGKTVNAEVAPVIGCSRDRKIIYAMTSAVPTYGQRLAGIRFKLFDTELEMICNRTMNFPVENQFAQIVSVDFKDEDLAILALDFTNIPKPNTRSTSARISNRKIYIASTQTNTFSNLSIALEGIPYVQGVSAKWSHNLQSIIAVSTLSANNKAGISTLLIQRFNESDTTPSEKLLFEIPINFRKTADLNNKKFRDTGIPKRVLKEVMDLSPELVEINNERFSLYATINRVNREIPTGQKPDEVEDGKAKFTHYTQGTIILNGTWSKGIYQHFENPMDQIIQSDNSPLPTGIAPLPHFENNIMVYNDLIDNIQRRDENFKPKCLNNENLKEAKSVLTYIDEDGRFSFYQPFSNPRDPGLIYPFSVFKENLHEFLFLGTDRNGKMRLVKATY